MSNRIVDIEIAGRLYPLNFSSLAAEKISDRYGDIANIGAAFESKKTAEMIKEVRWLLAVLIDQGVRYKKLIEGVDAEGLTEDELGVVLGVSDFDKIKETLMSAMTAGLEREVEVEDGPNAKAAQSS